MFTAMAILVDCLVASFAVYRLLCCALLCFPVGPLSLVCSRLFTRPTLMKCCACFYCYDDFRPVFRSKFSAALQQQQSMKLYPKLIYSRSVCMCVQWQPMRSYENKPAGANTYFFFPFFSISLIKPIN